MLNGLLLDLDVPRELAVALLDSRADKLAEAVHRGLCGTIPHVGIEVRATTCAPGGPDLWLESDASGAIRSALFGPEGAVREPWRLVSSEAQHAGVILVLRLVLDSGQELSETQHNLIDSAALLAAARAAQVDRADTPTDLAVARAVTAEQRRLRAELESELRSTATAILAELRRPNVDDSARISAAANLADDALRHPGGGVQEPRRAVLALDHVRFQVLTTLREAGIESTWALDDRAVMLPAPAWHVASFVTMIAALNAASHSQAERLRVTWSTANDRLQIEIADNGVGFDTDQVPEGLGLLGARQRVEALGGRLTVSTAAGWGVRLLAEMPLKPPPSHRTVDPAAERLVAMLGTRERDVLVEVGRGFANREIANTLDISVNTVKSHVAHLLRKLDVSTRSRAALIAQRAGLI